MKNNAWLKFPVELLAREDITPLVKIVYAYMLQRYHFFVVERKQQYYETQEEISKNVKTTLDWTFKYSDREMVFNKLK